MLAVAASFVAAQSTVAGARNAGIVVIVIVVVVCVCVVDVWAESCVGSVVGGSS